jgi:hypothetical protein
MQRFQRAKTFFRELILGDVHGCILLVSPSQGEGAWIRPEAAMGMELSGAARSRGGDDGGLFVDRSGATGNLARKTAWSDRARDRKPAYRASSGVETDSRSTLVRARTGALGYQS